MSYNFLVWKTTSYWNAGDLQVWCLQQVHAKWQLRSLLLSLSTCDSRSAKWGLVYFPTDYSAPGLPGVDSNLWQFRSPCSPSQVHNWKTWCANFISCLVKRYFLLVLGEGFKVSGCLSCSLPAVGGPPESFLQLLSCFWLSSCRSRFKSVFSQLLFPGIPAAAAAVHISWSPFSGRGLSFSPAALSRSLSYSSPSPAPLSLPNCSCNHFPSPATFPPQPVRRELALPL